MVLSGTDWTPETVENWLFRNCWAMGYHNFDTRRKADLRARIVHAIQMLSEWSSAVQPPEKSISVHDAMGGGDVMGAGEYGSSNGWSYSFGTWPSQAQQPQTQMSSIQFPAPAPTPAPVNVRDWATDNDTPQRKSRSPSPHPRRSSTGKAREIFIPPDIDWINPHPPPTPFRPRSRNPTPDPGWDNAYPPESNNFHSGSRVPRADPYSLESFDRSINSMLHQSRHRNAGMMVASGTQPVIPINIARKHNEKQRKKERTRERQSKWLPRGRRSDSDTSDSSDDEEPSHRAADGRPWHIYAQPTSNQPPQMHLPPPIQSRSHSQSQQQGPPSLGPQDPSLQLPKHRPSSLKLSPPVAVPTLSVAPQMPPAAVAHMPIGLHSPPQSLGPAQLAQYQFEQQHQVYQFQQQQQQQQQQRFQQQQQHQQHHPHQHHHHQQQQSVQSWPNAGVAVYR